MVIDARLSLLSLTESAAASRASTSIGWPGFKPCFSMKRRNAGSWSAMRVTRSGVSNGAGEEAFEMARRNGSLGCGNGIAVRILRRTAEHLVNPLDEAFGHDVFEMLGFLVHLRPAHGPSPAPERSSPDDAAAARGLPASSPADVKRTPL
jgi:hypothetical protein